MNIIARPETPRVISEIVSTVAVDADRKQGAPREPRLAFPNLLLRPFMDIVVPRPCAAAAGGVCLVATKAQVWSAYPRLPKANRILGELSQAVCEETDTPLLILLNGAGAALFEPRTRPQRILPVSAYDRFGLSCSIGFSLEQVTHSLKADPRPAETVGAFVRRAISGLD